jgi:hypothetical protein
VPAFTGAYLFRPKSVLYRDWQTYALLPMEQFTVRACKRQGRFAELAACISRLEVAPAFGGLSTAPGVVPYVRGTPVTMPASVGTLTLAAVGRFFDPSSPPLALAASAAWSSTDASVARVDGTAGVVRALASGTSRVVATHGAAADTLVVRVADIPVAGTFDLVAVNGRAPTDASACHDVVRRRACPVRSATYVVRPDGTVTWTAAGDRTGSWEGTFRLRGNDDFVVPLAAEVAFPAEVGLAFGPGPATPLFSPDGGRLFTRSLVAEAFPDVYEYVRRAP